MATLRRDLETLASFHGRLPMPPDDPFAYDVWEVLGFDTTPARRELALVTAFLYLSHHWATTCTMDDPDCRVRLPQFISATRRRRFFTCSQSCPRSSWSAGSPDESCR